MVHTFITIFLPVCCGPLVVVGDVVGVVPKNGIRTIQINGNIFDMLMCEMKANA